MNEQNNSQKRKQSNQDQENRIDISNRRAPEIRQDMLISPVKGIIKPSQSKFMKSTTMASKAILHKKPTVSSANTKKIQHQFTSKTLKDNIAKQRRKNVNDLDTDLIIKQIAEARVRIQEHKQKHLGQGNKHSSLDIIRQSIDKKTNISQYQKNQVASDQSSSSSDSVNSITTKKNKNMNVIRRARLQGQEEFLKGFKLLEMHHNKSLENGSSDPLQASGDKILKVKEFINEAVKEHMEFEKSSTSNDAMSDQSESKIIDEHQGEQHMKLDLKFLNKSNQVADNDQNQISQSRIQEINNSFNANQLNVQSQNMTFQSEMPPPEAPSQQIDDNNRSKLMNFSLLDDQIMKKQMPKLIINPTALWKTIWNVFILILILFLAITVPYRIPFENDTPFSWVMIDFAIDCLFLSDVLLNFFTAYEDENGELVTKRKKIMRNYLKTWFFVDLLSSIPISLIQYLNGGQNDNIKLIKLSRLPRLYRLLRLVKLMRLYKSNKFIEKLFAAVNISVTANRMINSLIMMIFLLHLIGCLWATVASLTVGSYPSTWMDLIGVTDSENIDQYIASVYWAAVTIYTVGYGDIVPQNEMEMMSCVLILFTGVSLYAYMFSKLSTLFSSTRDIIISELALRHRFNQDLTNKIQYFFQQNSNLISLSKEYAIDELLSILPAHLKSEISYFLYRDAIETIKILQDKDQRFYGDYLTKFEPMRIKNGTLFAKEGTSPQEVFFLLKGCVQCERQDKYYLEGTIFGETDIILKRNRQESYVAKSDCYILKLESSVFEQILDEFNDIREEILEIVVERERKRLEDIQQSKFKKEDPKYELSRLMSKINFNEIQRKQTALMNIQKQITQMSMIEDQTNQKNLSLSPQQSAQSQIISQQQPTQIQSVTSTVKRLQTRNLNLKVDTGKNYGTAKNDDKQPLIKQLTHLQFRPAAQQLQQQQTQESVQSSSILNTFGNNQNNTSQSPQLVSPQIPYNNNNKPKISLLTPSFVQNKSNFDSPEFNYNKLIRNQVFSSSNNTSNNNNTQTMVSARQPINPPQSQPQNSSFMNFANHNNFNHNNGTSMNRVSMHLMNIEDIKQNIRQSMSKEDFDKNTIEERLHETKQQIRMENQIKHLMDNKMQHDDRDLMLEYGHDSQSQEQQEVFNTQLRMSLQKIQNQTEQKRVQRQITQRDKPVQGGNLETQFGEEGQDNHQIQAVTLETQEAMPQQTLTTERNNYQDLDNLINNEKFMGNLGFSTSNQSNANLQPIIIENNEPYNPQNDPLLENDVKVLSSHITSCLNSISNTRMLILEYCQLFKASIDHMGEEANEIIRQHYTQGSKCLESYLAIMNLIEKLINSIDLQHISDKISSMQIKTNESEKRFYFIENRVKMLQEILARKIKQMERHRARMMSKKPLVIVKRNPLLDPRDDKHTKFNQKLMGKEPSNM